MPTLPPAPSLVDRALVELCQNSPAFRTLLIEQVRRTYMEAGITLTGQASEEEQLTNIVERALEERAH